DRFLDLSRIVRFVHHEEDGGLRAAQEVGELAIGGSQSICGVADEEDGVGLFHRDLRLAAHLDSKRVELVEDYSACVDDGEGAALPLDGRVEAIARYARRVLHDGDPLSDEPVEYGRLADVGPPDHRDEGVRHYAILTRAG